MADYHGAIAPLASCIWAAQRLFWHSTALDVIFTLGCWGSARSREHAADILRSALPSKATSDRAMATSRHLSAAHPSVAALSGNRWAGVLCVCRRRHGAAAIRRPAIAWHHRQQRRCQQAAAAERQHQRRQHQQHPWRQHQHQQSQQPQQRAAIAVSISSGDGGAWPQLSGAGGDGGSSGGSGPRTAARQRSLPCGACARADDSGALR